MEGTARERDVDPMPASRKHLSTVTSSLVRFETSLRLLCAVVALGFTSACTTIAVYPVDAQKHPMELVCIEDNPQVAIGDFLIIIQNEFMRHGILTEVYEDEPPKDCEYLMTYTARRSWDLVSFMATAYLKIDKGPRNVASASYKHSGGFGLSKYASTESKMKRVINELLADF